MATLDARYPENNDIKHYLRDVFKLIITVTNQDDAAVDLSEKTLVFSIRLKQNDTPLVTISGDNITVSGGSNNVVTIEKDITAESLTARSYFYDLDNTTDNKTIIDGLFIATYDGR